MRKLFTLALLLVVFSAPVAAEGTQPPLCGIIHMDVTTGQYVCDDQPQPQGIIHMDDMSPEAMALLEVALIVLNVTSL